MLQDGSTVIVKNGNISEALQRFKRNLKAQNLFIELKRRKEFTKPSKRKREAINIGKRRREFKEMENKK
jgi:ribosomal protein S21